jgi:hypothetical protein
LLVSANPLAPAATKRKNKAFSFLRPTQTSEPTLPFTAPTRAGPSRSRKSAIVSFLAGMVDRLDYDPGPTVGVRILELERNNMRLELWDTAGDQTYENTWPAIQKDADGVLVLYNIDTPGHAVCRRRRVDGDCNSTPSPSSIHFSMPLIQPPSLPTSLFVPPP